MPAATHRTGLLLDAVYRAHDTGPGRPESAARIMAVIECLQKRGLADEGTPLTQQPAEPDDILLCHTRDYFETVRRDVASGAHELSTGDTAICPRSLDIALRAAGGVMNAVDAVMTGRVTNAFCAVRPPGHHAGPAQGMGFCLFNNIAIAARHAQRTHGVEKVLIVDWDVHHGNGTQDIFYEDGSVFFFSTHQSPWYPGTGAAEQRGTGKGRGSTLNCPLPAGTSMPAISSAFLDQLLPAAAKFKPDLVLISAGFDSRIGDPLGQFHLTDPDFAELTQLLKTFAEDRCEGRIVSILEGGYNLAGLSSAVYAHVNALMGN
jgi:acetoin utilization deacetylase AcuC-like enzyme